MGLQAVGGGARQHHSEQIDFRPNDGIRLADRTKLVTRQERIDDFIHEGEPPIDQPLQILCEDHNGTYVIPFLCRWREGGWQNAKTSRSIEATVIGWRAPKEIAVNRGSL